MRYELFILKILYLKNQRHTYDISKFYCVYDFNILLWSNIIIKNIFS